MLGGGKSSDPGPVPKLPSGMNGGTQEQEAWLETFEDDLTMAIAVRDWETAVTLAKKG